MHYPDRTTVCVEHPGRVRDGVRVLRHRPGRLRAPPDASARSSSRSCGPPAGRARRRRRAGCRNVVFMGMGEPLANYDAVWARGRAAPRRHRHLGPPPHHLDGRHRARHPPAHRGALPVNLAVSLHAANDDAARRAGADQPALPARRPRRGLRRVRRRHGPPALVRVGADRRRQRPRHPTPSELAAYARARRAHVNLIPLNPTPGLPHPGHAARGRAALPRPARRPRRQRHRPPEPRHRHRRRLRPAPGRARGHDRRARPAPLTLVTGAGLGPQVRGTADVSAPAP